MPTQFPPKGDADKKIGAYAAPLSVSQQDTPNMTVRVRAGAFYNGANEFVEYSGGNSPILTAPVGNPKWVVVAITNASTIAVFNGTPAAIPSLPDVPAGHLQLAAVFLTPSTSAITQPLIVDVRPFLRTVDIVPNLVAEIAARPTVTDVANMLTAKADITGTPSSVFTLNSDYTSGVPGSDAAVAVARGSQPTVSIRWNETTTLWELTNDGTVFYPIPTEAGTYAPVVHTHVAADITNFSTAVSALVALSTIAQSQVTGLVADLAAKASDADLDAHTGNAAIHFTLPLAQSDITGLLTALNAKADVAGDTFTGTLTVQAPGNQQIQLVSSDAGSSGLAVDRGVQPQARLEWDETSDAWLVGTLGSMSSIVTGSALDAKADKVTQVIAGTGLTGGGSLTANVTIGLPTVLVPVSSQLSLITTDAQGRITSTAAAVGADLPAHTHVAADITNFTAAASAAAPVQAVAGRIGNVVITSADLADFNGAASAAAPVQAVAGRTGSVVLTSTDLADFTSRVVTDTAALYVNTTGDTMSGNLAMGGFRVTGLAAAGAPGEAVRYDEFNGHTHVIADVAGLQPILDGKASTIHTHVITDVTGLQTALDGKAALVHTHTASQITDFSAAADARIAAAVGVTVQPFNATIVVDADIGSTVQAFDAGLTSLSNVSANGFVSRTAADSFTARSIAGTATRVTVTNADGVAGDPTINVVEAGINHDGLLNFVAAEHVDHSAVSILAGVGLNGGGDLTATRTVDVAASKATGALTFAAIAVGASADTTLTVTGAAAGDTVTLGFVTPPAAGFIYQAYVSGLNTVTIRATNIAGGTAAGDANVTVNAITLAYAQF